MGSIRVVGSYESGNFIYVGERLRVKFVGTHQMLIRAVSPLFNVRVQTGEGFLSID